MSALIKTPQPKPHLPWYKNYMIMVFVIGMPLFVVLACIYLVVYSVQNADSTVRDDWYMDGKTLYADVSKDKLAYDMGLSGAMTIDGAGGVNFTLNPATKNPQFQPPATLTANISHATKKDKDRDVKLTLNGNQYQGNVQLDNEVGKYYIVVHDELNTWRLRSIAKLPTTASMTFTPLDAFDSKNSNPNPRKPSDVKIDERKQQN